MVIRTISFSQSREMVSPMGLKKWDKYGVEIECTDTDDPEKVKQFAQTIVEKWHSGNNPELANHQPEPPPIPQPKQSPEEKKQETISSHIKTINECETLKNVMMFENLVSRTNEPELTEAFEKRVKELGG